MVGMDLNISIALIIAIVGCVISVINVSRGGKHEREVDLEKQLKQKEEFTKINMKLDELCRGSQNIQVVQQSNFEELRNLTKRVIVCESEIQNMNEKIDNHEVRLLKIEDK